MSELSAYFRDLEAFRKWEQSYHSLLEDLSSKKSEISGDMEKTGKVVSHIFYQYLELITQKSNSKHNRAEMSDESIVNNITDVLLLILKYPSLSEVTPAFLCLLFKSTAKMLYSQSNDSYVMENQLAVVKVLEKTGKIKEPDNPRHILNDNLSHPMLSALFTYDILMKYFTENLIQIDSAAIKLNINRRLSDYIIGRHFFTVGIKHFEISDKMLNDVMRGNYNKISLRKQDGNNIIAYARLLTHNRFYQKSRTSFS